MKDFFYNIIFTIEEYKTLVVSISLGLLVGGFGVYSFISSGTENESSQGTNIENSTTKIGVTENQETDESENIVNRINSDSGVDASIVQNEEVKNSNETDAIAKKNTANNEIITKKETKKNLISSFFTKKNTDADVENLDTNININSSTKLPDANTNSGVGNTTDSRSGGDSSIITGTGINSIILSDGTIVANNGEKSVTNPTTSTSTSSSTTSSGGGSESSTSSTSSSGGSSTTSSGAGSTTSSSGGGGSTSSTTSSGGSSTSTSSGDGSTGSSTSTSSSTTSSGGGGASSSTGGPGDIETEVDEYFENDAWFYDGTKNVRIKVFAEKTRIPIKPIPVSCPLGYSQFGTNSNIFDYTTLPLPFTTWGNNIFLSNELVRLESSDYYYKVFNVNGIKVGGVIYKITNPNFDYFWIFTACLED